MAKVLIEQADLDAIGSAVNMLTSVLGGIRVTVPETQPAEPAPREAIAVQNGEEARVVNEKAEAGPAKRAIPWGLQCMELHPDFIEGLLWIESQIALAPEVLVPCMKFESNLNPRARNPQSSASGLIQFMTGTAVNLGTDIGSIRQMDAMQQLGYVYKYFQKQRDNWHGADVADVYMAILWPKAVGKPDDYVLWSGATEAYRVNRGLDWDKSGQITKGEAAKRVRELQKEGFAEGNVAYV